MFDLDEIHYRKVIYKMLFMIYNEKRNIKFEELLNSIKNKNINLYNSLLNITLLQNDGFPNLSIKTILDGEHKEKLLNISTNELISIVQYLDTKNSVLSELQNFEEKLEPNQQYQKAQVIEENKINCINSCYAHIYNGGIILDIFENIHNGEKSPEISLSLSIFGHESNIKFYLNPNGLKQFGMCFLESSQKFDEDDINDFAADVEKYKLEDLQKNLLILKKEIEYIEKLIKETHTPIVKG